MTTNPRTAFPALPRERLRATAGWIFTCGEAQITTSPFVYRGAVFRPEKFGNLQRVLTIKGRCRASRGCRACAAEPLEPPQGRKLPAAKANMKDKCRRIILSPGNPGYHANPGETPCPTRSDERDARRLQSPTHGTICVPCVELCVSHAWGRHGSTRGTGQVPWVKRADRHGMRMLGGLPERQLPFKRVKTAVGSFMLPLGACLALPSGASQACPEESLKYETLSVSSMRLYRSQV